MKWLNKTLFISNHLNKERLNIYGLQYGKECYGKVGRSIKIKEDL